MKEEYHEMASHLDRDHSRIGVAGMRAAGRDTGADAGDSSHCSADGHTTPTEYTDADSHAGFRAGLRAVGMPLR